MEAERFGLDVEIEIVAETLAALRTESRGIGFGRTEQTELHRQIITPSLGSCELNPVGLNSYEEKAIIAG